MISKAIRYNKLWKILIDINKSNAELRKAVDIAPNTLTKLRVDDEDSLEVLRCICECLDCNIGDICEYSPVEQPEEEQK